MHGYKIESTSVSMRNTEKNDVKEFETELYLFETMDRTGMIV